MRERAGFFSLLFVALALAPALAHLLELPNKIGLGAEEYLTVQQIYRGWALLGWVVGGALVSMLLLAISLRGRRGFPLALIALLGIVAAQGVFWTLTFPVNQETVNWSVLPENWRALRARWEYSHAAGAVLHLIALVALIRLCGENRQQEG